MNCGKQGTIRSKQNEITTKERPKFGVLWVIVIILTGGLDLIAWLIWPRHEEVISVDRYNECTNCGVRQ